MHHGDAALMLKYLAVEWLVKGVTRLQKDKKSYNWHSRECDTWEIVERESCVPCKNEKDKFLK